MGPINKNNPTMARQMEQGYGSYQPQQAQGNGWSQAGQMASSMPNAYAQVAGLGLQAIGQFQQSGDAQQQYELAVKAWQEEQERQRRQEESQRQQQILGNLTAGGNYSQGLVGNAQTAYGTYARQVGY
jgi:hypothetical protein